MDVANLQVSHRPHYVKESITSKYTPTHIYTNTHKNQHTHTHTPTHIQTNKYRHTNIHTPGVELILAERYLKYGESRSYVTRTPDSVLVELPN